MNIKSYFLNEGKKDINIFIKKFTRVLTGLAEAVGGVVGSVDKIGSAGIIVITGVLAGLAEAVGGVIGGVVGSVGKIGSGGTGILSGSVFNHKNYHIILH
uniref:Uncharacterized protein n=1 Tax=Rhabditophanes sp. KR3021 TaxID=114890 RepID=A0AC35TYT1_9BILA